MKSQRESHLKFILKYLKPQKRLAGMLVLFSMVNIGMQLITPQISKYFIDEAAKGNIGSNLTIAALLFLGAAFLAQCFNVLVNYIGQKVAWRATNDIRTDLLAHCIDLDLSFHKDNKPGELIERVEGDVSQLFDLYSGIIISIFNNFVLLLGILVILFMENRLIGFSMTMFSILAIYALWSIKFKTEKHWIEERKVNAEFYGMIGEVLVSAEDISSNGAGKYMMRRFYNMLRSMFPTVLKANLTWSTLWSATVILFSSGTMLALSGSLYLWNRGLITLGTVYLIFQYTQTLRRPIEQIRMNIQQLQSAGASVVRVRELFRMESKLEYGREILAEGPLGIECSHVEFQYEEGAAVLKDVSFQLNEGRVLGILGRTGSGKTTLACLLARMYDATNGEILIGQKNIASIREDELTKSIAYVTQDVQIFTATVRDNLTMFQKDIDDETILHVIYELGFYEWYEGLGNGLDTYLKMGEKSLSAGEAQLIAFVRVLLRNPKLIILDEAASRMDAHTEKLMETALDTLLLHRTGIIIAHRLATLARADDILLLQDGEVRETGERKSLSEDKSSLYYNLLQQGANEVLA